MQSHLSLSLGEQWTVFEIVFASWLSVALYPCACLSPRTLTSIEDSDVYQMLQRDQEEPHAPRQSGSFKALQDFIDSDGELFRINFFLQVEMIRMLRNNLLTDSDETMPFCGHTCFLLGFFFQNMAARTKPFAKPESLGYFTFKKFRFLYSLPELTH